jgi:hypothetical protein
VRGHAHDGAGAVVGEDVVGDPDGNALAVERVNSKTPGGDAMLFDGADIAGFARRFLLGDLLVDLSGKGGVLGCESLRDRVFRCNLDAGRAEDGVDPRGEDGDLGAVGSGAGRVRDHKVDIGAFGAADPVALHGANFFGPAFERVEAGEEFVGVSGDAEEPLGEVALLDEGVFVTPAAAADDLLVGEDGGAERAPVDLAFLAVSEAGLEHFEEEPLVPAVIVGQAGGDFGRPVEAHAEALELRLHCGDV